MYYLQIMNYIEIFKAWKKLAEATEEGRVDMSEPETDVSHPSVTITSSFN